MDTCNFQTFPYGYTTEAYANGEDGEHFVMEDGGDIAQEYYHNTIPPAEETRDDFNSYLHGLHAAGFLLDTASTSSVPPTSAYGLAESGGRDQYFEYSAPHWPWDASVGNAFSSTSTNPTYLNPYVSSGVDRVPHSPLNSPSDSSTTTTTPSSALSELQQYHHHQNTSGSLLLPNSGSCFPVSGPSSDIVLRRTLMDSANSNRIGGGGVHPLLSPPRAATIPLLLQPRGNSTNSRNTTMASPSDEVAQQPANLHNYNQNQPDTSTDLPRVSRKRAWGESPSGHTPPPNRPGIPAHLPNSGGPPQQLPLHSSTAVPAALSFPSKRHSRKLKHRQTYRSATTTTTKTTTTYNTDYRGTEPPETSPLSPATPPYHCALTMETLGDHRRSLPVSMNLLPSPPSTTYSSTPSPPAPRPTTLLAPPPKTAKPPSAIHAAAQDPKKTSDVDCYTCRRRRVKCDRQLPHCAKCERTKLDCLGYTKPLVWNKGVASRGKMMGKTFPAPVTAKQTSSSSSQGEMGAAAATGKPATRRKASMGSLPAGGKKQMKAVVASPLTPGYDAESQFVIPVASANPNENMALTRSPGDQDQNPSLSLHVPTGAGSPFGGMSKDIRFYMNYFEQRVASDFVLFDNCNDNPYRLLLPQAASHPALQNAMLAVAARHHSNLTDTSANLALPYKVLSFHHLSQILRLGPAHILTEPTLAVIMLFLFFETLDGGLDTWRVHLQGAQRLIQVCAGHRPITTAASSMLRMFTSHVTLIDIIGRTLSRRDPTWDPITTPETLNVLRAGSDDSDTYNFLGCPPELLETLHFINEARRHGHDNANLLLGRIDTFNTALYIHTRATPTPATPPPEEPNLRHLVNAYRAAARIYCLETLFPTASTDSTHAELRSHLDQIPRKSVLMKGAVWPVFVAGTGARGEAEREWTRESLRKLWEVLPQCNIRNAGRALEAMWARVEEEGGGVEGGGGAWKRWGAEGDWLFI